MEVLLITERDNRHRYKNVCLVSDGDLKLACTDRDYEAGEKIKFIKEFHKEFFRTVTKSLKIVWDNEYARIADIKEQCLEDLNSRTKATFKLILKTS